MAKKPTKKKPAPRSGSLGSTVAVALVLGLIASQVVSGYEYHSPSRDEMEAILASEPPPTSAPRPPAPPAPQKRMLSLRALIHEAAEAERIDAALLAGVIQAESAGRQTAASKKGAIGLTQLMPATAKGLKIDPRDPEQNVHGGARYLRQLKERFHSRTLALVAFNWGPANTDRWIARGARWSRLPMETRDYVSRVSVYAALAERAGPETLLAAREGE